MGSIATTPTMAICLWVVLIALATGSLRSAGAQSNSQGSTQSADAPPIHVPYVRYYGDISARQVIRGYGVQPPVPLPEQPDETSDVIGPEQPPAEDPACKGDCSGGFPHVGLAYDKNGTVDYQPPVQLSEDDPEYAPIGPGQIESPAQSMTAAPTFAERKQPRDADTPPLKINTTKPVVTQPPKPRKKYFKTIFEDFPAATESSQTYIPVLGSLDKRKSLAEQNADHWKRHANALRTRFGEFPAPTPTSQTVVPVLKLLKAPANWPPRPHFRRRHRRGRGRSRVRLPKWTPPSPPAPPGSAGPQPEVPLPKGVVEPVEYQKKLNRRRKHKQKMPRKRHPKPPPKKAKEPLPYDPRIDDWDGDGLPRINPNALPGTSIPTPDFNHSEANMGRIRSMDDPLRAGQPVPSGAAAVPPPIQNYSAPTGPLDRVFNPPTGNSSDEGTNSQEIPNEGSAGVADRLSLNDWTVPGQLATVNPGPVTDIPTPPEREPIHPPLEWFPVPPAPLPANSTRAHTLPVPTPPPTPPPTPAPTPAPVTPDCVPRASAKKWVYARVFGVPSACIPVSCQQAPAPCVPVTCSPSLLETHAQRRQIRYCDEETTAVVFE